MENDYNTLEKRYELLKQRYRLIVENTDVVMFDYIFDTKRIILEIKDNVLNTLFPSSNCTLDEVSAHGKINIKSMHDFLRVFENIEGDLCNAETTISFKRPDGSIGFANLILIDKNDTDGKAIGFLRDVTVHNTIKKERQYISAIAENCMLVVIVDIAFDRITDVIKDEVNNEKLKSNFSFSKAIAFASKSVYIGDKKRFLEFFNSQNLINLYNQGKRQDVFEYRSLIGDKYIWLKCVANFFKDFKTENLMVVFNIKSNEEQKRNEMLQLERLQYCELLMKKVIIIYTINFSQDILLKSSNRTRLGSSTEIVKYSKLMEWSAREIVHPDDSKRFSDTFVRLNILELANRGEFDTGCEYRRKTDDGEYIWVNTVAQFSINEDNGDLMGFLYISDINEQKTRELQLIYNAQHDSLTGLYNKCAAQKCITDCLDSRIDDGRDALFMFDIDNFKKINDKFGHLAGDKVLAAIGKKIVKTMDEFDIVGRIGGDEFVMLVKDIGMDSYIEDVVEKLNGVIKIVNNDFPEMKLSASIGIAIFPEHGKTFDELYKKADIAMYFSKATGTRKFTVYNEEMDI